MKIVRGVRQFVSNSSVAVRALVVSVRGVSQFVSNSCISVRALVVSVRALVQETMTMYMTGALFWDSILKNSRTLKNFTTFDFQRMNQASSTAESFCHLRNKLFFLLRNGVAIPPGSVLPQKINPEGLSEERRNYLYREIRQFCKPGTEDLVAPVPWSLFWYLCRCDFS